jgi:hypothetical protein
VCTQATRVACSSVWPGSDPLLLLLLLSLLLLCRDTMSFATKLCHVVYADGSAHDVMKHPATDKGKISLPGGATSTQCVLTERLLVSL